MEKRLLARKKTHESRVVPLGSYLPREAGGKALGIALLSREGLKVPPGFVVLPARGDLDESEVLRAYAEMGRPLVAVRSSASGEDGSDASYAGQFETFLNVQGDQALLKAIRRCIQSADSLRVRTYSAGRNSEVGAMAVIVQAMVPAELAGVVFSCDEFGLCDRVVVEAVPGLGDQLVSGHRTPSRYVVAKSGELLAVVRPASGPELPKWLLDELRAAALRLERALGRPVDMEWALDDRETLWLLQVRPITRAPGDLHEFDSPFFQDHLYTRANFGEVLPGALAPLTISTAVQAIDTGIRRMFTRCGVPAAPSTTAVFAGHLFFDLTAMLELVAHVAGTSADRLASAILGHEVPELKEPPHAPFWVRWRNGLKYVAEILGSRKAIQRLERLAATFRLEAEPDARATYEAIDAARERLHDAYDWHMQSSALSGLVLGIVDELARRRDRGNLSYEILSHAGQVVSVELLAETQNLARRLADSGLAEAFLEAPPDEALTLLERSADVAAHLGRFLARFGHRGPRELTMEAPAWADAPETLVPYLKASLQAHLATRKPPSQEIPKTGTGMALLSAWARKAVRQREYTKDLLVRVTYEFKRAYARLGRLLAEQGILSDPAQVVLFTHEELGRLVEGDRALAAKASQRLTVLQAQQELEFPHHFVGRPVPATQLGDAGPDVLVGRPVCPGIAVGPARVVRSAAEAESLKPGEILIAPVIDVAWSPYFGVVAGVATDVGSAMSHGAVVAREYGVPTVVGLERATSRFETGDWVFLDGSRGVLRPASESEREEGASHADSV